MQIAFAVAAGVAAVTLLAVAFDRIRRRALVVLAVLAGLAAVAAWVGFGLRPGTSTATAAGGITIAFVAQLAAVKLRDLLRTARRFDDQLARAQGRINSLIAREADERNAELERTLVRARADTASILAEQERRMAEERRVAAAERARLAEDELGKALTAAQQQVEVRLIAWTDDLERAQRGVADQLTQLAQRQKQLIAEAEARIASDAERLEAESEQQRASLVRLRDELARASQEAVAAGSAEVEGYASERRRSLHELNERIRTRERQLTELIEREEADATRRIQAGFTDVERRQLEQLERIVSRATSSYSDAATQQFADTVKSSREVAQVGDAGAQRLERRQAQVAAGLDRQRTEAIEAFEARLLQAEQELRRRLDTLAADTEAERAVLDARLRELAKRLDETFART